MKRYLETQIVKDLKQKMVFVAGPRQVGKTTLAKSIVKNDSNYLNWDIPSHKESILKRNLPVHKGVLVLDEMHKYRKWRNYLKGLYDEKKDYYNILVTGSAKLDYYRFGGDSLQGRYHFLRLHTLSYAEVYKEYSLDDLLKYGGFPEPFLQKDSIFSKRWSQEYRSRLVQEELTSLEQVQDVGTLELMMLRLPDLVGSPLSINSLREDLQINHKTVSRWLDILEKVYAIFRLAPFGAPKIKAVKKEQKHYHFDWTLVEDIGDRFENMVACHLLKWVHYQNDTLGENYELRYFRDVTKKEVDFVMLKNNNPIQFIECKVKTKQVSSHLKYLKAKFPKTQSFQISLEETKSYLTKEDIVVCSATDYLKKLV